MSIHADARAARSGRASRILGNANQSTSEAVMKAEGANGTPPTKKMADNVPIPGKSPKSRFDKPKRARGGSVKKGKTNVTVIVAPQGGAQPPQVAVASGAPPVPPMQPNAGPGPAMAPPGGAMPPQMPPRPPMGGPGMPMRRRGGAVKMAGAGSGIGRLEKL